MNQDLPSPPTGAGATTPEGASSNVRLAGAGSAIRSHLSPLPSQPPPAIPDHELLRRIGHGSYGEVWLARTVLGELRAVKIVHRAAFDDDRPFQREFEGLQKFAPISRSHHSQLAILHVGRHEADGCFYYVMELADAADIAGEKVGKWESEKEAAANLRKPTIDPQTYTPKTLRSLLSPAHFPTCPPASDSACSPAHFPTRSPALRCPLPPAECVRLGLALAEALTHLHQHNLVHRDIKPSNIIFVGGVPKLADIGLVTDVDASRSFVGTEGYLPPEGPGTPQADIYGLGKVLYELCTGKDRKDYPALPPDLRERPESEQRELLELNAVLVKACATDPHHRYQSAEELHADLALLQRGQSVKRRRAIQRRWIAARKFSGAAMLLTLFGVGGYFLVTTLNLGTIVPSLRPSEPTAMDGTTNLQAFKRYVQGRAAFNQLTPEGKKQAIHYLTEAIQLDPKFLRAYEKLFDAYINSSSADADSKAREIADTLDALDPNSEEAHLARGWIKYEDWEFAEAERHFKLAISANPNRPLPHGMYGCFLVEQGRVAEARIQLQLCDDLDPGFPIVKVLLGRCYYFERRYAEAIAAYHYSLSVAQNYSEAYRHIAQAQEACHEILAAIDAQQQARIIEGEDRERVRQQCDILRQAFREAGERGYWLKRLAQAKVEMKPEDEPYKMASLYARLGDKDLALDWLDKAYVQRDWRMRRLLLDQCWDGLREGRRFDTLRKNVGFIK